MQICLYWAAVIIPTIIALNEAPNARVKYVAHRASCYNYILTVCIPIFPQPVRPASRIRGYYISWRKLNSGRFNPIDVDDPYETTYILKKLAPGTTYEVFVQAYNQNYHSPPSRTESLKTLPESKRHCFLFLVVCFLYHAPWFVERTCS